MSIYETFAELRKQYPEDIQRIEADETRVSELLKRQEFAGLEVTQELLAVCRRDIVFARMRLATNRTLNDPARAELWHVIDARGWFLKMVAKDYEAELTQIERELEAELSR